MTHTFRAKESGVEIPVYEILHEAPALWRVALAPGVMRSILFKSEWDLISPLHRLGRIDTKESGQ